MCHGSFIGRGLMGMGQRVMVFVGQMVMGQLVMGQCGHGTTSDGLLFMDENVMGQWVIGYGLMQ